MRRRSDPGALFYLIMREPQEKETNFHKLIKKFAICISFICYYVINEDI
jgi:hypothetical protein